MNQAGWLTPCDGVASLRGRTVALAGRLFVDGEDVSRPRVAARVRVLGGRVAPAYRVWGVDILVIGDMSSCRISDSGRGYTQLVLDIEDLMLQTGRHVHVISDLGFDRLLHGRSASCARLHLLDGRGPGRRAA